MISATSNAPTAPAAPGAPHASRTRRRRSRLLRPVVALTLLAAALSAALNPLGNGARADAVGGAQYDLATLHADYERSYNIAFRAGELAQVKATGDTDIDMYVYDANGNLIDHDTLADNEPICDWTPLWTGTFKVKIVNASRAEALYVLRTN